jgi:hypothetical protein
MSYSESSSPISLEMPFGTVSTAPPREEEALLEELYSFVGEGWEQEDDITLLTLKRSASLS